MSFDTRMEAGVVNGRSSCQIKVTRDGDRAGSHSVNCSSL